MRRSRMSRARSGTARPATSLNLVEEWWPDAYVQADATPVAILSPGTDATGIDFVLDEGRTSRGR